LWSLWRKCYEWWNGEMKFTAVRTRKTEDLPCLSWVHISHLERLLTSEGFTSDDEVKTAVQHWVKTLAADQGRF
jgi:hypothetical protein